jgi:hypothetical protein
MSILFLLGAGASRGSEKKEIKTPACGVELFQDLQNFSPLTWGKLEQKYGKAFRDDFEKGMDEVLKQHPKDVSELQRSMAEYFFNFYPSPDNLYLRIFHQLDIKKTSFASLNYDRLLDQAILRSGFSPNYKLDPKNEKEVEVCLPHGCCNFFLKGFDIPPGGLLYDYNDHVFDSSDIKIIRDNDEFQNELKLRALPPIMACFNSNKTSAVGKRFLESQKIKLEKMVLSASLIVIIGVTVREHDEHIWEPLKKTNAKLVYCAGEGYKTFSVWNNKYRINRPDLILDKYFSDNFDEICNVASSLLVSEEGINRS